MIIIIHLFHDKNKLKRKREREVMKIFRCFCLIIACYSFFTNGRFVDIDHGKAKWLSKQEMRFCYISFVKVNGVTYLVKQKKFERKLLGVVRDALTAYIAESLNVPGRPDIAHRVDIIPSDMEFHGKIYPDWPATIHTIAPGETIKAQTSRFDRMNIKLADIGLRRDMFDWMAMHPSLPVLVGLDIFKCNQDRHRKNFFYNPKTDSFCAIDMDSAYKYNLCRYSYKNLKKMIEPGNPPFTKREIRVLKKCRDTIVFLMNTFTADDIIAKYEYFAKKAGFTAGSPLYTKKVKKWMLLNKEIMVQAYVDVQKLVTLMNEIIEKYNEKTKKNSRI